MAKIPPESLTVELKSDRNRLSDRELVEAVVCLANTEGGSVFVGVEDDGRVTGLHRSHDGPLDGLAAMVANRTAPPLAVQVTRLEIDGLWKSLRDCPQPLGKHQRAFNEWMISWLERCAKAGWSLVADASRFEDSR